VTKGALIIGSSAAGLQAALDLADSGIPVHLVEPTPFLGNRGATTLPAHLLNARLLEIAKHPNVTTWTNTHLVRAEGGGGRFHVALRRHPRYVDLSKCTACGDCIEACPVTVPGTGRKAIYLDAGQPRCVVIDKVGKPPCSNACPGGIHVQGYVALIAQGRFQEALDLIREAIPFPGICGRICTHPCEFNCRRAEVDAPVAIRLLKRFVSDWEVEETANRKKDRPALPVAPSTDLPKVAVVGAGPAGMTVADRLARQGYRVTVFEKLPVIGGMMAVGIPEYRLPREVIAREYRDIQALGVEVRLNTPIGPDGAYTLDDLFGMGYRAVCLAVGAHKSRSLRIPGEDLPGVVHGIELLKAISLSQQVDDPRYRADLDRWLRRGAKTRAVVLGGGNTAMDVARSLRRLGLDKVRILYRRSRAEMPALPEEVEDAEKEGVEIAFLVSPVRVLGDAESGVTGLVCQRMKLGEPDAGGRRRPVPIAGSEFTLDLDLVVLAIGQLPDLDFLGPDHGLAVTRAERINVDGLTFMTNRPGVFAVGDAVTTDKMAVIEAIGMGKKAAAAIDAFLRGLPPHEVVVDARDVPIARREMTAEELAPKPPVPVPTIPLDRRVRTFDEVERAFSAEQAVAEANRCLICGPCSECLACERACRAGAILHAQEETLAELDVGAILTADGVDLGIGLPDGEGVYRVAGEDPVQGSAAAARMMAHLFAERQPWRQTPPAASAAPSAAPGRIGVFVCQCGGEISDVVDTEEVCRRAAQWPAVVHTQTLAFSCSPEAAQTIREAAQAHALDGIVLAACSCCTLDQVCYSCTYQRVRCKTNLGLLPNSQSPIPNFPMELVNIREQCAWPHADDPAAATATATALIAAAAAKVRRMEVRPVEARPVEPSALILGGGAAAVACRLALGRQGIAARQVEDPPQRIGRSGGRYVAARNGVTWRAAALVLAPADEAEAERLLAAFDRHRPRPNGNGVDTHRPGVFLCDPALEAETVGAAAAARVAAWLGRIAGKAEPTVAVVDPALCRACGTCVEVCEFGAPELIGQEPQRASWIDPLICTGCGTCAAHCPSGAITAGYATDAQIELMLERVIGGRL